MQSKKTRVRVFPRLWLWILLGVKNTTYIAVVGKRFQRTRRLHFILTELLSNPFIDFRSRFYSFFLFI